MLSVQLWAAGLPGTDPRCMAETPMAGGGGTSAAWFGHSSAPWPGKGGEMQI